MRGFQDEREDMTRIILTIVVVLALAGCRQEPPKLDSGLKGYDPHLVETARADCVKKGGRFGQGGTGGSFLCFQTTKDANKSCTKKGDCDGLCLARSRTCAPVKPLFGCNDVLTDNGVPATICIE